MLGITQLCKNIERPNFWEPWVKVALGASAIAATGIMINKILKTVEDRRLRKVWDSVPKDTIVLHLFPRAYNCPPGSPFVLKLETFLRIAEIPYVTGFERLFSKVAGKTPWITFNGEDIADSQLSIKFLTRKLGKDMNKGLTQEQKAYRHSIRIMLESHFALCFGMDRYVYSNQDFFKWFFIPAPSFVQPLFVFTNLCLENWSLHWHQRVWPKNDRVLWP